MTVRWYRAYRVRGRPEDYTERVSNFVRNHSLADIVPSLRFERLKGRHGKTSEFYIFLGINSDAVGEVPEMARELLRVLGWNYAGDVLLQEIKKMVSSEIDIRNYARTIKYQAWGVPDLEDPFDLHIVQEAAEQLTGELIEGSNRLLYLLSAIGSGTWNRFRNSCQGLGLTEAGLEPRQIFRKLRLLGHIEYLDNGSKWTICPGCIVQINQTDDNNVYFLAGQRTTRLVDALPHSARIEFVSQPNEFAPECIRIFTDSKKEIQEIIKQKEISSSCPLQFAGASALHLTSILPNVEGYRAGLPKISEFPISMYSIYQWRNGEFVESIFKRETGMYQVKSRMDPQRAHQFTLFYDDSSGIWRRGDWYGLRYLARLSAGECPKVYYHNKQRTLALQADYRWPDIYERAIVLSSGQLPKSEDGWLYYQGVSPILAQELTEKLSGDFIMEIDS